MSNASYVTIGVPAYRAEFFIEETLSSIQNQTHGNIEVIISLDGPQPSVEQLCQPFLKDSRFRLVVQPERLGWVGNINWLMAQVKTPYWYCHPQDDLVDRRYVEVLLDHAQRMPEAAVVYCDLVAFGTQNFKIVQPSVTGNAWARQMTLLGKHHSAVAFRGLTRVEALHHSGGIPANEIENFSADTTWMAAVARWGELQRVPVEMYQKRYHTSNEHTKWATWPVEKRARAWTIHCVDMLEQAMLVDATVQERRLLWLTVVERLASREIASHYLPAAKWTLAERALRLNEFFEYIQTERPINIPVWLEDNWNNIQLWTREFDEDKALPTNFWRRLRNFWR